MIKLCIWMDIPSHHQRDFFYNIDKIQDINISIRYFGDITNSRVYGGKEYKNYLKNWEFVVSGLSPEKSLQTLPDWRERIHIVNGISSPFCKKIVDILIRNNVRWCAWGECGGVELARRVNFSVPLFRLFYFLYAIKKHKEAKVINKHAVCAFGQGLLARKYLKLIGVKKEKIEDLYYAVKGLRNSKPNPEVKKFANSRKVFMYVGKLCKRKGVDVLIKAFAKVKTNDWCLVLTGFDAGKGYYQKLCQELGIQVNVLFTGTIQSNRINEYLESADVFILPSRFDGWGVVLNEAASLGKPLISTDQTGAAWHLIEDGKNGYRVKAGNVKSLYNAMSNYVSKPEIIKQHGANSKDLFYSEFIPEKNAERLLNTLLKYTENDK